MKKPTYIFAVFALFFFMVTDPLDAVEASRTGLLLWFNTIVPTLLPFIILSNIIIQLDGMKYITFWIAPILGKLLHISREGSYAVIAGFVCGYPMGAKITADLVRSHKISLEEGNYLLCFCNNVSPMFIISYIVGTILQMPELRTKALIVLYGAPLICALLFNLRFRKSQNQYIKTAVSSNRKKQPDVNFKFIDTCIMDSFETIVKLGGYIILFSIITRMIMHFPVHNMPAYLLLGNIEITNGLQLLSEAPYAKPIVFIMVTASASFGGMSSIAQTESMIKDSGLSLLRYITAKLINAVAAAVLSFIVLSL